MQQNDQSTIMVYQQSQGDNDTLIQALEELDYHCFIVTTLDEGKKQLNQNEIELIVIDTDKQKDSINNFLDYIRDEYNNRMVPVIILAEYDNKELLISLTKLKGTILQIKPILLETLLQNINHWSNHHHNKQKHIKDQHLLEEYKETIDASNIVSKADKYGFITYVNEQFCTISGYRADELLGKPHNIVRHPDMPSDAFQEMWDTITSKQIWRGKVKNRTKSGGVYYVDTTIKPIVDEQGDIVEFIGIRKDITEEENFKDQLQSELNMTSDTLQEMMKRSREYHKAMDESTILTRADLNGKITYINQEFTDALGYTSDEIVGKDHRVLKHPDTPKVIIKNLWDTILSGHTWKGMIQNINKQGETVWLDTVIVPIKNMKEEVVEYLTIRHNMSDVVHLHEEIETTQGELIYTLGAAAETRSRETGNHIRRVAHYSKLLALLYGLERKEAEILFQASPMHDIGKLAIPDHVLKKPGKLDDEEWMVMRTHSELGYKILNTSTRPILQASAIVAHEHHEKWDGSGYPRGLQGDAIHIYGRICAIADVFDALGSDRVYKKAWELDAIVQLLENEKGRHFDPQLVDLFINNLDKFLTIKEEFKDVDDDS